MPADKFYIPGSFYRICERTGMKTREFNTRREWQGLIVRKEVFEPRQPQDFVRGVPDNQTVPYPRPRPTNVFIKTEATAQFQVYGDNPLGVTFEIQNGQFQVFNGTVPPVNPANFPSGF